ncbi:MAG TPA: ankyrin repeat domain-containing protein [Clostridiales bacterium]|nr:ankyrin repeat domain-containing protein [Clostridiales bacterium]
MKFLLRIIIFAAVVTMFSCSSDEDKLFRAVKTGDSEKILELIEDGVSVLTTNRNGLTPLDAARLNGQTEIAEILYEHIKKIVEKDIFDIMQKKFISDLTDLKDTERERISSYNSYISANEKLLSLISDDKRISDELIMEEETNHKLHQTLIKNFINKKVDMIDRIEYEFNDGYEYSSKIGASDKRHIINVNIMFRLSSMN